MDPGLHIPIVSGSISQGRLRLEDERWWAVVFGTISAVVLLVLQTVEGGPVLVALSLPLLVLWALRAIWSRPGGWWLAVAAAGTFCASVWQEGDAEGSAFLIIVAIFYVAFREARLWALVVAMNCLTEGVRWIPELWTGQIVVCGLIAGALALLAFPPARAIAPQAQAFSPDQS